MKPCANLLKICAIAHVAMPKRKKVALLIESSRAYGRGLLRGVASYLQRTPNDEIQRVRIRRIKELLTGTELSLSEIAANIGFDHPEYLSTVFKKAVGITPIAFRRQQKA